jgi:glycyl-radical enzyme activating protein
MMYREARCVRCGGCVQACPAGAATLLPEGKVSFDRGKCDVCADPVCISECFHEGLALSGKRYSLDELERIFQRDRCFWGKGGGVSFSGGEPLLQKEFMLALLQRCRDLRIHTCVETTACIEGDYFMKAAAMLSWIFVDLKHMDSAAHRRLTGVGNELIHANLRRLAESSLDCFVVVRIPLIPGYNDSEENLRATARFVRELGLEVINILPFHRLGESKWRQVGKEYSFAETTSLERSDLETYIRWIREEGITCYSGWETPF